VLSKHTAFVAVEERDEATEGTMKVRKIPITFEKPVLARPQPGGVGARRTGGFGGGMAPGRGGYVPVAARSGSAAPSARRSSSITTTSNAAILQESIHMKSKKSNSASVMKEKDGGARARSEKASPVVHAPPASLGGRTFAMVAPCSPSPSGYSQQQQQQLPPSASALPSSSSSSSLSFLSAPQPEAYAVSECDEEAEEKAGPPPEQMRNIIMKQKASGSWDWSDAAGLVGLTADKLRSGIQSAKLLAGTPVLPVTRVYGRA
jgi:hypothetical protein